MSKKDLRMDKVMDIRRHCAYCGKEFIAHGARAVYCCKNCGKKSRRDRLRNISEGAGFTDSPGGMPELLNVVQASLFLHVSRYTIYRYIRSGLLKAVQFPGTTLIRKSDILSFFDSPSSYRTRPVRRKRETELPDPASEKVRLSACRSFVSTHELSDSSGLSCHVITRIMTENKVGSKIYRTARYYEEAAAASAIERYRKQNHPEISEWYTIQEIMDKYSMTKSAVYSMASENHVPKCVKGNSTLYSREHVDRLRSSPDWLERDYYTSRDIYEKYRLSSNQIYNRLKRNNIRRITVRGVMWVNREDFDNLMYKRGV